MSDGKSTCSLCDRPAHARDYCVAHYSRLLRHGDPLAGGTELGAPKRFVEQLLAEPREGCVFWPFATSRGYAYMSWGGRYVSVSRLICTRAHGEPPDASMHAAHRCGKGANGCVNPKCLYWATKAENESDKIRHGTIAKGERSGAAKLTDAQVEQIRSDSRLGKFIAADYGISRSQVSRIKSGKTRKS